MPNVVSVRRAALTDIDAIAPLFDVFRQSCGEPSDAELARDFLRQRIKQNEAITLIGLLGHNWTAGFAQLYPSFSSTCATHILILETLYVQKEARRMGVGTGLLAAVEREAKESGAAFVSLSTETLNEAAQLLYTKSGWERQESFCAYILKMRKTR